MKDLIDLSKIWAEIGGFNGLIVLNLFIIIAALIYYVMKMNNRLLDVNERLIDFKKAAWNDGLLKDRRGDKR